MSEFRNGMASFFGKPITKIIMVIFIIMLIYIISALIFGFWPFNVVAGVVQKVTNPTAIVQNYEYFYDMKEQIDAQYAKYKIAKDANMVEAPGIAMVLQGMIAEYNAKSKMITRNLWKAQDLPYQIKIEGVN